jgi:1-acyl-sn-glycerol-3-phosphate acyltransferase
MIRRLIRRQRPPDRKLDMGRRDSWNRHLASRGCWGFNDFCETAAVALFSSNHANSLVPESANSGPSAAAQLPRRNAWLFRLFRRYCRRYLARNFHAVRLSREGLLPDRGPGPLLVVMNHPSWWDPLIGLILTELLPSWRTHYAPIDEQGLSQYPFLERLGFFGVELGSTRGSWNFLRRCQTILSQPEATLWITPQGRFADPRERPIRFRQGIGHLVLRVPQVAILPIAVEYPFWNDRFPEALIRCGPAIEASKEPELTAQEWTARLEQGLTETMEHLAREACQREPRAFLTLLGGSAGVGGVYDAWRRFRARLGGKAFVPEHQMSDHAETE